MPNGGIDNCARCGFNKAVQEIGIPTHPLSNGFRALSYCTLRDVKVTNLLWTYCKNFRHGKHLPEPDERVEIEGPILADGLFERSFYVRIPWHDKIQPWCRLRQPRKCMVCGRKTDEGITVIHENKEISFCTNRHYIDWWKTVHDDLNIVSDGLATPEEFYKEMLSLKHQG